MEKMQVGDGAGGILKGTEVRRALGLSSALFAIEFDGSNIVFTSSGSGHGVGMSQWGAYALAMDGLTGEDIALHYYDGLSVVKLW